jgi:hypothetical protein
MMKVAVIGVLLQRLCLHATLRYQGLLKKVLRIYAIIAPSNASKSSLSFSEIANVPKLAAIGIKQTFLLEKFDYSAITQVNADSGNSYIKHVEPSLAIIPSWKSPNHMRRILARVSLIACRGIGTNLMCELDSTTTNNNNNIGSIPNIIFEASIKPGSTRHTNNIVETIATSIVQDEMEIKKKAFTNNSVLENKDSKTISYGVLGEKFESHRTLLLEEDELF